MMDPKHVDEDTNTSQELHPQPKSDGSKPTTEDTISGLQVSPEAKDIDDTKPTTESAVSGLEVHPEVKLDEEQGKNNKGLCSPLSSSSSSSSSASSFPLDVNGGEEDPLDDAFAKPDLPHSPKSDCPSPPDVSAQTPQWSMVSASPRSGPGNSFSRELLPPTPEWNMSNSSPLKSPLTQTMSRPNGYDPNRIPSSIFSTRPTTPMEWSVASNESLFSIHMGNSSFSKDHILMLGDNKQEDWNNSPLHMNSMTDFTTNLTPVLEAASENDKRSTDMREEPTGAEESSQKPPKTVPVEQSSVEKETNLSTTSSNLSEANKATAVDGTRISTSAPRVSDESGNSSGSFAFPV